MTRQEIMFRGGPELDALVATEIMGWQKSLTYGLSPAWVRDVTWTYEDGRTEDICTLAEYVDNWVPSTRIEVAIEVVETLLNNIKPGRRGGERYCKFQLMCGKGSFEVDYRDEPWRWRASFWFWPWYPKSEHTFGSTAMIAPLAICRAALRVPKDKHMIGKSR